MSKAIVKIGTSQYQVSEGQELLVNLLSQTEGKLSFSDVLFLESNGNLLVGQPYITGVFVEAEILGVEKGEKVRVSKFKAKSRYRKTVGFRPKYSRIRILSIGSGSEATIKSKSVTKSKSKSSEKKT